MVQIIRLYVSKMTRQYKLVVTVLLVVEFGNAVKIRATIPILLIAPVWELQNHALEMVMLEVIVQLIQVEDITR